MKENKKKLSIGIELETFSSETVSASAINTNSPCFKWSCIQIAFRWLLKGYFPVDKKQIANRTRFLRYLKAPASSIVFSWSGSTGPTSHCNSETTFDRIVFASYLSGFLNFFSYRTKFQMQMFSKKTWG